MTLGLFTRRLSIFAMTGKVNIAGEDEPLLIVVPVFVKEGV